MAGLRIRRAFSDFPHNDWVPLPQNEVDIGVFCGALNASSALAVKVTMKRWGLVRTAICLAFGFGMATTVCAANRAEAADVRCIAVAMHLASSAAPEQRAAGMLVAMYYFGKLDGSFPHADIERLIQRDSEAMTLAELRANAAQCAKTFEKKSREFARIDADLAHQRRGRPSRK